MIVRLHSSGPVEIITTNEGAQIAYGNEGQMYSIEPQKNVWVCTCGMSKAYPLCDGSHNRDEDVIVHFDFGSQKEYIDEFEEYKKTML